MPQLTWEITGDYTESCSCEYLCPCLITDLSTPATEDFCKVAMSFKISSGHYGNTRLDDLAFIVMAQSPRVMGAGNWRVGVIIDQRATEQQRDALAAIAGGQAGGPMAAFAPLIGEFCGVEFQPIEYTIGGPLQRRVTAGDRIDQAIQGTPSAVTPGEAIALDNTVHPANKRLNLGRALYSHFHVFGIDWDDASGTRNGHITPFHWRGPQAA